MELTDRQRKNLSTAFVGLLRHNEGQRIAIDRQGWADLDDVIGILSAYQRVQDVGLPLDRDLIAEMVCGDEKNRFQLSDDGRRIRATSGHSFEVDLGLAPFVPETPLYFGTVVDKADDIRREGLTGSAKNKVRLVRTQEEALAIAEARGCEGPLVLEIDAPALARDGFEFGIAPSGEILVDRFGAEYVTELQAERPMPRGA